MNEPEKYEADLAIRQWQRLSPWSMVQLSLSSIVNHIRILVFSAPAVFGALNSNKLLLAWGIPAVVLLLIVLSAVLGYFFFYFRIGDTSIQVRQGVLKKKHLDLAFDRVQNISIEEPFYYRILDLVTLKIDGAGSTGEEVRLAATDRDTADAISAYIRERQSTPTTTDTSSDDSAPATMAGPADDELFFTRSLQDLIIHGLTNNRAFIAVAGIFAFATQANISPTDILATLGINFDVIFAGLSMVRLALLFAISLIAVIGLLAFFSVIVSVFSYYGYSMYRTGHRLVVRRGLLSRHQIHVEKSRIHSIALRQDWLDRILGRYNILFEPISHAPQPGAGATAQFGKRILIPSVRTDEIPIVTDEILTVRINALQFTPASIRLFRKGAAIASVFYLLFVTGVLVSPAPSWLLLVAAGLWPAHMALLYLSYRRKGIAIDGDTVVVRSGVIGINYAIFTAAKLQKLMHTQSLLMRRRGLSTLVFQTASTIAHMPHIDRSFALSVLDFSLFRVETQEQL